MRPYRTVVKITGGRARRTARSTPTASRRLASLPPREVLLSQLAGAFAAPLATTAGLFDAPLRDVAGLIAALDDQKSRRRLTDARHRSTTRRPTRRKENTTPWQP